MASAGVTGKKSGHARPLNGPARKIAGLPDAVMQNLRHSIRPLLCAVLLLRSVPAPAASEHATVWGKYERAPRTDGTTSVCLEHRQGFQQGFQPAGPERIYVFQILNDCSRPLRARCDIAYTPTCSYGDDVDRAGRFEAVIEPHGEGSVFGSYAVRTSGRVAGCFFARCSEAEATEADAPGGPAGQ